MAPNRSLKQARELRGWSQAKVAREIGTDATTVSRWERGLFSPTLYFRERLCAVFAKNTQELGLLESTDQPQKCEQDNSLLRLPYAISSFQVLREHQKDELHHENVIVLVPPSWSESADIFAYILRSAAHDQQAHMLWKDAYVRALRGQNAEARQLGEASLRAFECIGHVNAVAVREWLNQEIFVSGQTFAGSVPAVAFSSNLPTASLPLPQEKQKLSARQFFQERSARIALLLIGSFWFLFALDFPRVK